MKLKKYVWLIMSSLITLVLILASCNPAKPETTSPTTVQGTISQPTSTPTITSTQITTTATQSTNKPQYGGTISVIEAADTRSFDDTFNISCRCWSLALTNDRIMAGDWTKGPAGTGEMTWAHMGGFEGIERYCTGESAVAESWELDPANNAIIFHIRQGVYWALNPASEASKLVNGRQMTIDDVISTLTRQWTNPLSFLKTSYPQPTLTKVDSWTLKASFSKFTDLTQTIAQFTHPRIFPADALAKYGDFRDWRNSVGTGAWMMTDYVKGSSITFARNPNYWQKNPIGAGKGDQLPYADNVKLLIITDISTQLAAMRTGKADINRFNWDMAATLIKTNPDIKYVKTWYNTCYCIEMKVNDPTFPWSNIKVRQAMMMGVDMQAIVNTYYGGDADQYSVPTAPGVEYDAFRVPLKDLPQNIQDLYKYQPDKAKQMLVDAGYPNGFDIEVVCQTIDIDLLSIYKGYWAKIGINLILDVKDTAVWNSISSARSQKNAVYNTSNTPLPFNMDHFRDPKTSNFNRAMFVDARFDAIHKEIWANYTDWAKRCQLYKDATPLMMEQCTMIPTPAYRIYTFWQPWIGNYKGEWSVGNCDDPNFVKYIWVDQKLKNK